ncbi:MAG: iron-containing alcohol dehydrogenase [Bacillales bacterium]|jgi:alcohol dehydrogenase class IV|nr:iron-containing alcohol dehydrogenase [Bacillales bacterium]
MKYNKLLGRIYQKLIYCASFFVKWAKPTVLKSYDELITIITMRQIDNVFLVTDNNLSKLNLYLPLLKILKNNKIKVVIFDEVLANPSLEIVEKSLTLYKKNKCHAIIAFGGGSSIDCAKMLGARVTNSKSIQKMKGLLKIKHKLPLLIAIPTTAGSGSEGTLAAVISDYQNKEKFTVLDFKLVPKYVVLDASLTLGLPLYSTGITGIDALSHGIESFLGKSTTRNSRKNSLNGCKLLLNNLPKVKDNNTITIRKNLLIGSFLNGLAFSRGYVGYAHGISHALTAFYNYEHGLGIAVALKYVLEYSGKTVQKKIGIIYNYAFNKKEKPLNSYLLFMELFEQIKKDFNIPSTLFVDKKDYSKIIEHIKKEIFPLYPVPKYLTNEQLINILDEIGGNNEPR